MVATIATIKVSCCFCSHLSAWHIEGARKMLSIQHYLPTKCLLCAQHCPRKQRQGWGTICNPGQCITGKHSR